MRFVVFAEQFRHGNWDVWEHQCSPSEVTALLDSALERSKQRSSKGRPTHNDLIESARRIFNVERGPEPDPWEGDIRVYCVCAGELVIGVYEKIRQYSGKIAETHEVVEVELEKIA